MLGHLFLCLFLFQTIEANGGQRKWMTLNNNNEKELNALCAGGQPEVVAHGGYSGLFPDSSQSAYYFALDSGILGTILYCNLHFTKDNVGFCLAQINLQNATNIEEFDPKGAKTYNINGQQVHGYFGLDYPANIIFENVTLRQNIFTRQGVFDGEQIIGPFHLVQDKNGKPTRLWLNIENDMFYNEHKISPETFILDQFDVLPEFISSPEIAFLKSIGPKLGRAQTKLIFTFLEEGALEPTTNVTYGSLAKNLATIKSFASGIVVPKEYIWPVNMARILQPATSLVQDAHKVGLAVYASGFANDNFLSFNYSYDPAQEYLQFVDNAQFSVDGVLSDFPSTASEAIALIISHNGASGDFPGATDLAYQKAIEDGADIIDCSVQMSKDGIAFCSDRADLMKTTTAATLYIDQSTNVPQIQTTDGIFSFDLTWSEIQSLTPQIENFFEGSLIRNPANKNSGKLVTLSEFLALAKTKAVTGVLISIQNAAFLASRGLDIVGTVSTALSNAMLDKQSTQKVLIQSDDSSVLLKFKDIPSYQRVFYLQDSISGAPDQVAQEVKKYADAVFVHRDAIVVASDDFAFNFTKTVPALHAANISVYVGVLKNEFENLIFDYLSDPYVELNTFYLQQVDGFITDYPATANSFVRSTCTTNGAAYLIPLVQPGSLYQADPVAEPPLLSTADVVDPPLPPIAKNETAQSANDSASSSGTPTSAPPPNKNSSTTSITVSTGGLFFAALVALLTIFA
ncbi:glycerophosphodiester phosphodiesterase gdpdl7 [Phtheirospermum japonicum]|uniref:glycerophosphodiester phosphodiesterase n=1 Tax=Phtheirospermum japonicum TaxID=374723 RepID=A0A830B7D2_9LAMI|nr:glycerophosphodiester phosphodiesterase gdpdl7 [Phtheirospermum japonicum]